MIKTTLLRMASAKPSFFDILSSQSVPASAEALREALCADIAPLVACAHKLTQLPADSTGFKFDYWLQDRYPQGLSDTPVPYSLSFGIYAPYYPREGDDLATEIALKRKPLHGIAFHLSKPFGLEGPLHIEIADLSSGKSILRFGFPRRFSDTKDAILFMAPYLRLHAARINLISQENTAGFDAAIHSLDTAPDAQLSGHLEPAPEI